MASLRLLCMRSIAPALALLAACSSEGTDTGASSSTAGSSMETGGTPEPGSGVPPVSMLEPAVDDDAPVSVPSEEHAARSASAGAIDRMQRSRRDAMTPGYPGLYRSLLR